MKVTAQQIKLVLIGGPAKVAGKYKARLAPLGIELVDHWDWDRNPGGTELVECDVVLLLTDMASHAHTLRARVIADAGRVPVIFGNRKWAWTQRLLMENRNVFRNKGLPARVA